VQFVKILRVRIHREKIRIGLTNNTTSRTLIPEVVKLFLS